MKRISSRQTPFWKRLKLIFLVLPIAWYFWNSDGAMPADLSHLMTFILALAVGISLYFFIHRSNDFADEVFDCDTYLLVKKGGIEEEIQLSNVVRIDSPIFQTRSSFWRVKLVLKNPSRLGSEIIFLPPMAVGRHPFIQDLIKRLDENRS